MTPTPTSTHTSTPSPTPTDTSTPIPPPTSTFTATPIGPTSTPTKAPTVSVPTSTSTPTATPTYSFEVPEGEIEINQPKSMSSESTEVTQVSIQVALPEITDIIRSEVIEPRVLGEEDGRLILIYDIAISATMRVELSSDVFEITPTTPAIQAVNVEFAEKTFWRWNIKPTNPTPGEKTLTLKVYLGPNLDENNLTFQQNLFITIEHKLPMSTGTPTPTNTPDNTKTETPPPTSTPSPKPLPPTEFDYFTCLLGVLILAILGVSTFIIFEIKRDRNKPNQRRY